MISVLGGKKGTYAMRVSDENIDLEAFKGEI